jgi:hypothetical protein
MQAIPRKKELQDEDITTLIEVAEIAEKKLFNEYLRTGKINDKMFKMMMRVEEMIASKEL